MSDIFCLIISPMIGTSPNNLSASFNGLNCFLKSSKANAALNIGPFIFDISVNGSFIDVAINGLSLSFLNVLFLGSSFNSV